MCMCVLYYIHAQTNLTCTDARSLPFVCCVVCCYRAVARAHTAFYEAGQMEESYKVLNQLLLNSTNENRFNDAAYYSWLLANHFSHMCSVVVSTNKDGDDEDAKSGAEREQYREKAERLYVQADIYYAYHPIYKYIVSMSQRNDSWHKEQHACLSLGRTIYFNLCRHSLQFGPIFVSLLGR